MIPGSHALQVRALVAAAAAHNVELPETFAAEAAHLADLERQQRTTVPDPAAIGVELAKWLGDPAGMRKARAAAVADVATADADRKVEQVLIDRSSSLLRTRMRAQRDALAQAFAPAAADALAVLNADAGRLPDPFVPHRAEQLGVDLFGSWTRCRDALAQLEQIGRALAPLYPHATDLLSLPAVAALRIVEPPHTFDSSEHTGTFALALAGIRHGGSALGPTALVDVFMPSAVAALGGTFKWATPTEVERRVAAITAAAVQPQAEQPSRPGRMVVGS